MNIRVSVIVTICFLGQLTSCINRGRAEMNFRHFPIEEEITGIAPHGESYFKTGIVGILDTMLLIMNTMSNENQIHIYNSRTFEPIASGGVAGRGPGEISSPGPIALDRQKRDLWFMDYGNKKIWHFYVDSIVKDPKWLPQESVPVPEGKTIINFRVEENQTFAFTGSDNDRFLTYFNRNGLLVDSLALLNIDGLLKGKSLSYETLNYTTYNFIESNRSMNRHFVAYRFSDIVEIVDNEGNNLKRSYGPGETDQIPDYANHELIKTFTNIESDSIFVFLLYLGKPSISAVDKISPNYSKSILVYDWEGSPVARLECDHTILTFSIDQINRRIVTFSPDVSGLVYYNLPETIAKYYKHE